MSFDSVFVLCSKLLTLYLGLSYFFLRGHSKFVQSTFWTTRLNYVKIKFIRIPVPTTSSFTVDIDVCFDNPDTSEICDIWSSKDTVGSIIYLVLVPSEENIGDGRSDLIVYSGPFPSSIIWLRTF